MNICDFTHAAGPLRYLSELEEWRHEHRGLALLLTVDSLIRKKVYRLNADQRKLYPSFSGALIEVLTHHKQLWNDARSSAELEKFKQAGHAEERVHPTRRRRTKLGERGRSSLSAPLVKPWTLGRKMLLRKMLEFQLLNGARSLPSSTRAPSVALGSTARWGVASVISARLLTCAWSAAKSTPGMEITEVLQPWRLRSKLRLFRLLRQRRQETRMKWSIDH